jgi:hypothetical protein
MTDVTDMADIIHIEHITKTYEGTAQMPRGTTPEWQGPALWLRSVAKAARLTSSTTPPVQAVREVCLTARPGEVFGLVGPTGSGKTTLIKISAGLIRPTSGQAEVAGISLEHPQEIPTCVSYVSTTGWMGLEWPQGCKSASDEEGARAPDRLGGRDHRADNLPVGSLGEYALMGVWYERAYA